MKTPRTIASLTEEEAKEVFRVAFAGNPTLERINREVNYIGLWGYEKLSCYGLEIWNDGDILAEESKSPVYMSAIKLVRYLESIGITFEV